MVVGGYACVEARRGVESREEEGRVEGERNGWIYRRERTKPKEGSLSSSSIKRGGKKKVGLTRKRSREGGREEIGFLEGEGKGRERNGRNLGEGARAEGFPSSEKAGCMRKIRTAGQRLEECREGGGERDRETYDGLKVGS